MRIRLSRLADAEVEKIHAWYDAREPGLGAEFRDELARLIGLIGDRPEMFAVAFDQMRRAVMKRFPYFLLYESFLNEVVVFGVIHGARDPKFWLARGDA